MYLVVLKELGGCEDIGILGVYEKYEDAIERKKQFINSGSYIETTDDVFIKEVTNTNYNITWII